MSFLELLLASGLLLGSGAASVGIWNQVSTALLKQRQDLVHLESLEAEMQAAEARLGDLQHDRLGNNLSCAEQGRRLVARLENQPPQAGVVRTIDDTAEAGLFVLRLRAGDQVRQRLYSPAAFGGCGVDAIGDPDQASASGKGEGNGDEAL